MSRLTRLQKNAEVEEKNVQKSKPKKQKEEQKEEGKMKFKNLQFYGPNEQSDNGIQQFLKKGVNAAQNQIRTAQKPEQSFKMNEQESITKPIVKNDSDSDCQKSFRAYISSDEEELIQEKKISEERQIVQKSSIETTQQQIFANNISQQIQVEENVIMAEQTQNQEIIQEQEPEPEPENLGTEKALNKFNFIMFGLTNEQRKDINDVIKINGGKVVISINQNTIVIKGEDKQFQIEKNQQYLQAVKKNCKILNVDEFSMFLKDKCGYDLKKLTEFAQSNKQKGVQDKEELKKEVIEEKQDYKLLIEPQSYQSKSKNFFEVDMRQSNKKQQQEEIVRIPQVVQNKEKNYQLWSVKYAPQKISECIDQSHVPIIVDWLSQWSKDKHQIDYGQYAKFNMKSNACLLSGPPGVGKTTMVRLICKDMKFQLIEWNASDVRSKLAMENQVKHLNDNSVLKFQKGNIERDEQTVILMDEVDGMSGSDKGGSRALTDLIKQTKNPIFCICNERNDQKMRTLAQNCLDIQFKAPDPQRVLRRLEYICGIEQIPYEKEDLMAQINVCQSDIRQLLNILQMHKFSNRIKFGQSVGKDSAVTTNLFDATNYMLQHEKHQGKNIAKNLELYFIDADMISLMYQENYLDIRDSKNISMIKNAARAASSLADADILNTKIRRNNEWALMPNAGFLGTLYPTEQMKGKFYGRVNFPALLGKISSMNKTKRQIQEIKEQFGKATIQSSTQAIKYDIIEYYAFIMISQLKDNAIDPCIRLLQNYGQTVASFQESICNCLSIFPKTDVYANVEQELRSALQKEFKAQSDTIIKTEGGKKGCNSKFQNLDAKAPQTKKYNELEEENEQFEDVEDNDEEQPKAAPIKKQVQKQKPKKANVQQDKKVKQKKVVKEVQKKKKKL